jgi:hypothetical protein
VRRLPAAGGAAPDAVVVYQDDLVATLVDLCGAGWAFAPDAGAPLPAETGEPRAPVSDAVG